jgi:hypothetical protein
MLPYLKHPAAVAVVLICSFFCPPNLAAADPLVIDDENFTFKTLYSTRIYGFRAFPISKIISRDPKHGFAIKADVLSDSLRAVAPGQSFTLRDLHEATPTSSIMATYTPVSLSANPEERETLAIQKVNAPSSGEYDAGFIVSAFGTELVDQESLQPPLTVDDLEYISLDPSVAMDVLTVYGGLNSLQSYENSRIPVQFNQFDNALSQHPELYAVAKIPIGDVSMGEPLIRDPDALQAEVPEEWRDAYSVKLFIFAVTIHDYLAGVEKIDVSIKLPRDCIVLDLVPLSYREEPMDAGGLIIGTMLGGQIEYRQHLKPVVEAYGLQSNEFGWQFRGEALGFGSKRIAALIRIPKTTRQVDLEGAFVLRGPKTWIAEGHFVLKPEE